MVAYAIVRIIDISDADEFEVYKSKAGPTLASHNAQVIVGGGRKATLEGEDDSAVVIIEFSSYEAAQAWYQSPEYGAAMKHRLAASSAQVVIAEGR